ncbi:MAG: 1,4-alpha-glucan branching enzyme, partial [Burkholderiaceae bacterium]
MNKRTSSSRKARGSVSPATPAINVAQAIDPAKVAALAAGRYSDPFSILGPHQTEQHRFVRVFLPGARSVQAVGADPAAVCQLTEVHAGFFIGELSDGVADYRLRIRWPDSEQETEDPYSFGPLLGELDMYLIAEGRHWHLADCLGAHVINVNGVSGTRFAVWAPNAQRVSVIGNFNSWDGRRHPMRLRHECGVWEIFIPRVRAGACYKFELVAGDGQLLALKADPMARQAEAPPATASVVAEPADFTWTDEQWMATREARQRPDAAISIYEAHMGSWASPDDQGSVWQTAGQRL